MNVAAQGQPLASDAQLEDVRTAATAAQASVAALESTVTAVAHAPRTASDTGGYAAVERAAADARIDLVRLSVVRNASSNVTARIATTQLESLAGRYANVLGQVDSVHEQLLHEREDRQKTVGTATWLAEDVLSRERDLRKIEGSVMGVAALMQELQIHINTQGEKINTVDDGIEVVTGHIGKSGKLLERTAKLRRMIKRKKRVLALVVIAGIVVAIVVIAILVV
jgi:t-SNARE complex subunit (syntaxin)